MTQLLDPSGPFACIWADDGSCDIPPPTVIFTVEGIPMTEEELLAVIFNGSQIDPAPIPLPAGGLLLTTALVAIVAYRRLRG